jgi:acyl dehydratase
MTNAAVASAGLPASAPATEPLVIGPVTRTDFVRYAGASGDMNPLHHDEEFCRAAGYPSPFATGMMQAGMLAAWLARWYPPETVRRFWIRFEEQVWPGDVLTCDGREITRTGDGDAASVEIEITCTRQTGGVAARAWATLAGGSDTTIGAPS